MRKQETIDIADSNIAMLGSDLERDTKKAAAKTEKAWEGAGTKVGLEIWRIEKFQVVPWPKDQYGQFYSGDSYIILRSYKKPDSEKMLYDLHFWLGKSTSQDEMGTAAYKTVELDTLLDDIPVQYREVQGHESALFVNNFPKGLQILEGGVDSGFNKVKPTEYKPRLMRCKGKGQAVQASQVDLTWESLNSGDVFVLDAGMEIFVWQGSKASPFEKKKGAQLGVSIKDSRTPTPKLHNMNEGDNNETFWTTLGAPAGGPGKVKSAEAGGEDKEAPAPVFKLFRLSDASGKMEVKKEAEGKLSIATLDSNDAFIVDVGTTVFVWIGKNASPSEKKKGMSLALEYLEKSGLPPDTHVSMVKDGHENPDFLGAFHDGARASTVRTTKSRKCEPCNKFLVMGACPKCGAKP